MDGVFEVNVEAAKMGRFAPCAVVNGPTRLRGWVVLWRVNGRVEWWPQAWLSPGKSLLVTVDNDPTVFPSVEAAEDAIVVDMGNRNWGPDYRTKYALVREGWAWWCNGQPLPPQPADEPCTVGIPWGEGFTPSHFVYGRLKAGSNFTPTVFPNLFEALWAIHTDRRALGTNARPREDYRVVPVPARRRYYTDGHFLQEFPGGDYSVMVDPNRKWLPSSQTEGEISSLRQYRKLKAMDRESAWLEAKRSAEPGWSIDSKTPPASEKDVALAKEYRGNVAILPKSAQEYARRRVCELSGYAEVPPLIRLYLKVDGAAEMLTLGTYHEGDVGRMRRHLAAAYTQGWKDSQRGK